MRWDIAVYPVVLLQGIAEMNMDCLNPVTDGLLEGSLRCMKRNR